MSDPQADVVSRQYEPYRYPEPIRDLEVWLRGNWQRFDLTHAHRVLAIHRYDAPARRAPAGVPLLQATALCISWQRPNATTKSTGALHFSSATRCVQQID
jgi:hypothetical protein